MSLFTKLVKLVLFPVILLFLTTSARSQTKITRKDLLNASIGNRTISAVKVVEIAFQGGQKGAHHKHPCPVVGYIVSGACLLQTEGGAPQVLKAGDAFYEPANTPIVHFDNYSDEEPMKFVAYYLQNGEKELIELLPETREE
jgi:quercetin dioxygenase-like cupin family protein